jgi:ribosomal protein L16/L10AE
MLPHRLLRMACHMRHNVLYTSPCLIPSGLRLPHPQLCEVKVRLSRGRGEAHEVAATLLDGSRVFRIDGRTRTAAQLRVRGPARWDA